MRLAVTLTVAALTLGAATTALADDFGAYAGAKQLCSEHVIGDSMHIEWSAWATKDDLTKVAAFYEKSLGKKATTGDKGERDFKLDANRDVTIYPVARYEDFPHCAAKPGSGDKTIVLVSRAIR